MPQTRAWQDESGLGLTVSVNVSGRQMADPAFVADVGRILSGSGLEPSNLTLEITESVLIKDVEATVAAFAALKALGIMLAIDDFGTGYSSLSYLRQFPIDILKVDRSFVASLDGSTDSIALVRSILNLGSTLRLDTVAEGIETAEQRKVLRGLGARRGQGYLFARPMTRDDLRDLLIRGATQGSTASRMPGPRADSQRPEGKPTRQTGPQRVTQPSPTVADEVR